MPDWAAYAADIFRENGFVVPTPALFPEYQRKKTCMVSLPSSSSSPLSSSLYNVGLAARLAEVV